ncbi:hypothetical protein MMC25_001825 [Agyrium rufum]|nr:hypothetical protein [Agyrium rufum]
MSSSHEEIAPQRSDSSAVTSLKGERPDGEQHAYRINDSGGKKAQHPDEPIEPIPSLSTSAPYSIFDRRQKALIVTIVSIAATFSGLASNIYFPSIPAIASSLAVTPELINLTVTSYMIFQGLSPTMWASIADVHGRRVTYICTFLVFFAACIGLAETRAYAQLLVLRCVQSTGSASTIAIGAGVVGDITTREERGGYMGVFQAGLLIPLAAGPVLGGVFAQTLGWRAIFWFLAIYSGTFLVLLICFLPETLRALVGNGSIPPKGLSKSLLSIYVHRRQATNDASLAELQPTRSSSSGTNGKRKLPSIDFLSPLRILFGGEVTCAIVFLSIYYTVWQMTVTVMSTLFQQIYELSSIQIGLTFIANGAGSMIGTLSTGKFLDYDYKRFKAQYEKDLNSSPATDFPLEKARLRTIYLWSLLQISSTVVFGWTLDRGVHISVPIICTFVLGWAATSIQSVITTFLVDVFPKRSASATAALNLSRCLMGAGGTAAVLPITNGIGVGWTFTLFTGIMASAIALIEVQMRLGGKWRKSKEVEIMGEAMEKG